MKARNYIPKAIMRIYPYFYPLGKSLMKLTNFSIMKDVGHKVFDTQNSNISYIPINKNLALPEGIALPVAVAEHFIRVSSNRFLMAYCPCRNANDCEKHPHDIGCIWIGGATAPINLPSKIGRHVSVDEAIAHLHRARAAGLITTIGKFTPDAWAMGVFAEHHRFMTLCSCCSCCCMVKFMRYGLPEYTKIVHKLQGLTVQVDRDKCQGCGSCASACIFGNIALVNGKSHIGAECKGCGFCAEACPHEAIIMKIEDAAFTQEAVNRISGAVDVT